MNYQELFTDDFDCTTIERVCEAKPSSRYIGDEYYREYKNKEDYKNKKNYKLHALTREVFAKKIEEYKKPCFGEHFCLIRDSRFGINLYGYISPAYRKKDVYMQIAFDQIREKVSCGFDWDALPEEMCLDEEIDRLAIRYLYWMELKLIKKSCQMLGINYKLKRYYEGDEIKDEEGKANVYFTGHWDEYDDSDNYHLSYDIDYAVKFDWSNKKRFIDTISFKVDKHTVDAFLKVHKVFFEREIKNLVRGHSHKLWAESVKERDDYVCLECGSKENIEAHHIKSFQDNPERRYDVENGTTLCKKCHRAKHNNYFHSVRN